MESSSEPIAHRLVALATTPRLWRVVMAWIGLVVGYLALTPTPPQDFTTGWDKLNHFAAFSALSMSGSLGFRRTRVLVFVLLALIAYGGLIEVAQYFVPGRSSEWADLAADAVGIACGAVLVLAARMLWRNHRQTG
jgi:VanZ family protein